MDFQAHCSPFTRDSFPTCPQNWNLCSLISYTCLNFLHALYPFISLGCGETLESMTRMCVQIWKWRGQQTNTVLASSLLFLGHFLSFKSGDENPVPSTWIPPEYHLTKHWSSYLPTIITRKTLNMSKAWLAKQSNTLQASQAYSKREFSVHNQIAAKYKEGS